MKKIPKNTKANNSDLLEKHLKELETTGSFNVLELPIFKELENKSSRNNP